MNTKKPGNDGKGGWSKELKKLAISRSVAETWIMEIAAWKVELQEGGWSKCAATVKVYIARAGRSVSELICIAGISASSTEIYLH